MKHENKILSHMFVYLAVFSLIAFSANAEYPASLVDLGAAENFAVLSKVAITSASASAVIAGDIGVSPASGASITLACSELTGTIWQVDAGLVASCAVDGTANANTGKIYVDNAVLALGTAYTAATGGANTPAIGAVFLNLGAGTLTARTLSPGVYTWGATLDITGDITLDCAGNSSEVFVFQIGTDLDLATTKQIILAGGCQASRIFWAVGGTTVLHEQSHLEGTIITGPGTTEITLIASTPGATVNGRLLGSKTIALQANSAVTMPVNSAPSTSSVTSAPATASTASINWTTNIFSNSTVNYGVDSTNLSSSASNTSLVMSHTVLLSGLTASTLYYFNLTSCDAIGSCDISGLYNFTTSAAGGITIGNSSDIATTLPNLAAKVNGTDATDGMNLSGTNPVNLTSNGLPIVDFNYDFDASPLNFSALNVTNGTRSSASYMIVNGVNSTGAQVGTKTIHLYGVSTSFNGICVQNIESASVPSTNCNGSSEFALKCDGIASNGVTCTKSTGNTTITVSGLQNSGIIQFVVSSNPAPINLGTSGNFVVLAKTGISTTGTTSINGHIGVSPIDSTAITGFGALPLDSSGAFSTSILVNGSVYAADYASPTPSMLSTAISDMQTAYTTANGLAPDVIEIGAGNIGGLTLTPGVYKWGTGLTIPTDVTLSGNSTSVWVFQVAQTLDLSNGKQIILSGGAQAKNIFWVVAGQTTIGTTAVFNGNILDKTEIVMNTGTVFNGRALAQTAVTVGSSNVSLPASTVISSDILPPIVTLNTPDNTWTNDNQTSFNFTFVDAVSATANCSLFISDIVYNTSLTANNTSTLIAPNSSLAEGAYSWHVDCIDLSGNTGISASRIININDNTTAPILSNISSSSITYGGAVITWTTNEVANSTVNYGTALNLGSTAESSALAASHSISLSLSASTLYYYNVTSCDPAGNCNTSSIYNFTTAAAPSSGGGGGSSTYIWACTEWSACSSNEIQTRNCTNQGTGSGIIGKPAEIQSCTYTQPTAASQTAAQTAPQTTASDSFWNKTGDAGQENTEVVLPAGNQITGQAVREIGFADLWWAKALGILAIILLVIGGYFIFRNK